MAAPKKVSQAMQELLAQIGENAVLLTLAGKARGTPWKVFKNVDDRGFDLLLRHPNCRAVRVEVKTRQRVWTTAGKHNLRTAHFTVTSLEQKSAKAVVCYWWERGWMFVVPSRKLKRAPAGSKRLYKFVVHAPKSGKLPGGEVGRWLERWSVLAPEFSDGGPLLSGSCTRRPKRSVPGRKSLESSDGPSPDRDSRTLGARNRSPEKRGASDSGRRRSARAARRE